MYVRDTRQGQLGSAVNGGDALTPGPDGEPRRVVVVNTLPAAETARTVLVVLGMCLGAYLLWLIHQAILLLFLAVLLATSIEPIVNRLRRGPFSRGSGVLVVYTTILLALGVPTALVAPGLVSQGAAFVETLPATLEGLRPYADDVRPRALRDVAVGAIDQLGDRVQRPGTAAPENLVQFGATAIEAVLSFFTVFVLAFYWLVERATIKRALLRLVPARRAKNVNTVWIEVEEKLGGWVRGQLVLMLAIGVMAAVGYAVIGLPNPILLGVAAALGEMIPLIGAFVAFAPAVLVALTIDPSKAIVVIVYAVIIQQIESTVLVPRVMGHTVGVSPLTVLLGILVGSLLYGLPGAFLAVPVAGAIQVILAHTLRMEGSAQAEAHSPPMIAEAAQEAAAARAGASHPAESSAAAATLAPRSEPQAERETRDEGRAS